MPTLQTSSGSFYYRQRGAGAPVIALHGSASTGAQWTSLAGCVAGRFRILTPDLPGYGRSDAPAPRDRATLAGTAGPIAALIGHRGPPAHLVGHGFGGAVALALAIAMPERVRSLTLIEPAAFSLLRAASLPDRRLLQDIDRVAGALTGFALEGDPWTGMGRFVDFWNGPGAWLRTSDRLRLAMAATTGRVREDLAALAAEPDRTEQCRALRCPTLCIMGLQSPPVSMRVTERIAEIVPGARLEMVADAGHMAPLTDPHVIDPMILRHLLAAEAGVTASPATRSAPMAA